MNMEWNDKQPIYRQLRDMVVERIIDGSFPEGEAVPSVRQVATDYQINHLTVAKAYQELVDLGLLETRRGLGMFVITGAKETLTDHEQQKFLTDELPAFVERVRKLGIDLQLIAEKLREAGETV
ncbi:MAG: GntR family transcriptional regulator [Pseudomonadales bacterium]|nr:GntR family transcriptional regulator [Pseudomonadales bacterium]